MSLIPADADRCWYTMRSHERGYIWRCMRKLGHPVNLVEGHALRREPVKSKARGNR